MKKRLGLVLALLMVVSLLMLPGCTVRVSKAQPSIVKSYSKEIAPSQVVKTDNRWVMLHSTYEDSNYAISVGESPDTEHRVYSVSDVSIRYFDANDNGIVWCEKSSETYTYKVYSFETDTVETVFQSSTDVEYQPQNVGLYLDTAYCCFIDYEQQKVQILAYDIKTKAADVFYTVPFVEEGQPYSFTVDGECLSLICSDYIKVFNLQNDEVVFDAVLPESVKYVYTASYDRVNDTCALYYYIDGDSENIGTLKEGQDKITSVFTFSENHYAYRDTIEFDNGHIYWIAQANVSGWVSDHYRLVDYNYLEHKAVETERAFDFYRGEDALYVLRFNKNGEYTHVDLCRY